MNIFPQPSSRPLMPSTLASTPSTPTPSSTSRTIPRPGTSISTSIVRIGRPTFPNVVDRYGRNTAAAENSSDTDVVCTGSSNKSAESLDRQGLMAARLLSGEFQKRRLSALTAGNRGASEEGQDRSSRRTASPSKPGSNSSARSPSVASSSGSSSKVGGMARKQVSSWPQAQAGSPTKTSANSAAISSSRSALSPNKAPSSSSQTPLTTASSNTMPPPPAPDPSSPKAVLAARKQTSEASVSRNNNPSIPPRLRAIAPRPGISSNSVANIPTSTVSTSSAASSAAVTDQSTSAARPTEQKRKADALASRESKRRKLSPMPGSSSARVPRPEEIIDISMSDDEEIGRRPLLLSTAPRYVFPGLFNGRFPHSATNAPPDKSKQNDTSIPQSQGRTTIFGPSTSRNDQMSSDTVHHLTQPTSDLRSTSHHALGAGRPFYTFNWSFPARPKVGQLTSQLSGSLQALSTAQPQKPQLAKPGQTSITPSGQSFAAATISTQPSSKEEPRPDKRSVWASVYDPADRFWTNFPKVNFVNDLDPTTAGKRPCSDAYEARHGLARKEPRLENACPFLRRNIQNVIAGIAAEKFPDYPESIKYKKTLAHNQRPTMRGRDWPSVHSTEPTGFEAFYRRRLLEEQNLDTARIRRVLEIPIMNLQAFEAARPVRLAMKDQPRVAKLEMTVHMHSSIFPIGRYHLPTGSVHASHSVIRQSLDDLLAGNLTPAIDETRMFPSKISIRFSMKLTDRNRNPYRGVQGDYGSQSIPLAGPMGRTVPLIEPVFFHRESNLRWKLLGQPHWAMDYQQNLKLKKSIAQRSLERDPIDVVFTLRDDKGVKADKKISECEWRCPGECTMDIIFGSEQELAVHMALRHRGEYWVEPEIGPRDEIEEVEQVNLIVHEGAKPAEPEPEPDPELAPELIPVLNLLTGDGQDMVLAGSNLAKAVRNEHLNRTAKGTPSQSPNITAIKLVVVPPHAQLPASVQNGSGSSSIPTPQSQYDDPISPAKGTDVRIDLTIATGLEATAVERDLSELQETASGLAGPYMRNRNNKWTEWSNRVDPGTLADLMPELDKIYHGGRDRHNMRDLEELHIWQQHHLSAESRFLACCWNRWRHQHVSIPYSDPKVYYESWIDAYGAIMARAGLTNKLRSFVYAHYKHKYITFKVYAQVTAYYNARYPKWSDDSQSISGQSEVSV